MSTKEEIKAEEIRDAQELVQAMLKAKKNLRLYPSNNPMYAKIVDTTFERVSSLLKYHDRIELKISRNEILLGTEPVYHNEAKDDNLALFFFRDGLRTMVFEQNLSREEFQGFLEIISVDFDREDVEDDIVTLLWEKDFQHIKYTVDENAMLEDEQYEEKAVKEAREDSMLEDRIKSAYDEALGLEDVRVPPPVPINDEDIKTLTTEVQQDSESKVNKLTDILFDMLYLAETLVEFKDITRIINNLVEFSIRHDNIAGAYEILRRTKELIEKSGNAELKKHLGTVFASAGSPPMIKVLGELLESKQGVDEKMFLRYASLLSVNAIPSFISLLGDLESITGRKNTIAALSILGKKDLTTLLKGLRDNRWFVVRNIIHALRRIGDKRAVDPLIKEIDHPDIRVRKEIIKTLGEIKAEKAVSTLQAFMYAPDKSIRLTTFRALGSIKSDSAKLMLIEKLSDRKTQGLEFEELRELFEILARWKDDDVLNFLLSIISKNPLFGRARYNDFKAGAAHALGMLGRQEVSDVLEKLRSSKHKLLSEHASAALMRTKHAGK